MEKVRVSLTRIELSQILGGLYMAASRDRIYAEDTRPLFQRLRKIQDKARW